MFTETFNPTAAGELPRARARLSLVMSLALALALLACGCAGTSEPVPIWFGHVATLSGPDKHCGEAAGRGIRLAVEEIDKDVDQGVGRPIKVIHCDARGKPDEFEAEAIRLTEVNRAQFLFGGASADELDRLNRAPALVITPRGARTRGMSDAVYCTGLAPAQQGKALAEFAAVELGAANVAVLCDDRLQESVDLADIFTREFNAAWSKKDAKAPVSVRRLRLTSDSKPGDIAKQLQDSPDIKAVVFAGKPADLRDQLPLPGPILFAGDDGAGPALSALRPPGKEIYFVTAYTVEEDLPRALDFAKRYREAFHEEADVHAALAYEGIKLLNEAMIRGKDSLTQARVRDELKKLKDFTGLTGPLSFTDERQLRRPAFVIRLDDGGAKTAKRFGPEI